jgi:hypothetical protein
MILATRLSVVCQAAGIAAAALALYLMTGWVAAERKNVTSLDAQIARTKLEIAKLTIELGSRARMGQLERWNSEVLALSAPKPEQFVDDGLRLASLEGRSGTPALPLDPAIAGQTAPQKVALVDAGREPALDTAMIRPALATTTRSEPLLRHAAFVQPVGLPSAGGMDGSEPAAARRPDQTRPARQSLLPADVAILAAAEAKAGADAKARR